MDCLNLIVLLAAQFPYLKHRHLRLTLCNVFVSSRFFSFRSIISLFACCNSASRIISLLLIQVSSNFHQSLAEILFLCWLCFFCRENFVLIPVQNLRTITFIAISEMATADSGVLSWLSAFSPTTKRSMLTL